MPLTSHQPSVQTEDMEHNQKRPTSDANENNAVSVFERFDFVKKKSTEKWVFRTTMCLNPSL